MKVWNYRPPSWDCPGQLERGTQETGAWCSRRSSWIATEAGAAARCGLGLGRRLKAAAPGILAGLGILDPWSGMRASGMLVPGVADGSRVVACAGRHGGGMSQRWPGWPQLSGWMATATDRWPGGSASGGSGGGLPRHWKGGGLYLETPYEGTHAEHTDTGRVQGPLPTAPFPAPSFDTPVVQEILEDDLFQDIT
ncbi:hypothetical protein NDU88_002757 [Pleurodeles waltl]|uniref:Uncharacterized protein n=1 Tax=Pleurodeles waltl TaxID=8319 RepID=A0AAV7LDE6_PLEWA|nr:hypothetical protein NDU88_002757 [Pleurodeles waltl]